MVTFGRKKGEYAVEKWLVLLFPLPQAIICANDFMAITVASALEERGITIPKDMAISGCDDVDDAAEYSPLSDYSSNSYCPDGDGGC